MNKKYKIVNDTAYDARTNDKIIEVLEHARVNRQRVRIFYGDVETGKCWLEEYDVIGKIGRSTGIYRIPLLIKSERSMGGGGILDHCIVKVTIDKKTVYEHKNFYLGEFTVKPSKMEGFLTSVHRDGECIAQFKKEGQAERYIAFMKGERNSK